MIKNASIAESSRKVVETMAYLKLRPGRMNRKKHSCGQPEAGAVTGVNGRYWASRES
jgi:hypothetical protein